MFSISVIFVYGSVIIGQLDENFKWTHSTRALTHTSDGVATSKIFWSGTRKIEASREIERRK